MATATAPPARDAATPPAPWHVLLQSRVTGLERAAAALLAVCEEPEAQAALAVRVQATHARAAR